MAEVAAERDRLRDDLAERQQKYEELGAEAKSLRQARGDQRDEAEQRHAEFTKKQTELDQETATSHKAAAEAKRLEAQLEEAHEQAEGQQAAAQVALSHARGDLEELREQLSQSRKQLQGQNAELDELRQQVEQLQQQLASGEGHEAADSRKMDELRRRFELAVQDVRELKSHNAELEAKLAQAANSAPSASTATESDGALDWEAQKQKMLAQLDDDFDEDDEQDAADRLTVEGSIRITDQVVADKEQEIAELQTQLEEQSSGQAHSLDNVAVGASAIAEMLDQDELIKQERENLVRIQEEWREKLRKAEIDISVERAKIARKKSQLEDRLQTFESQRAQHQQDEQAGCSSDSPKRSSGSRWLARLGLNEGDKS